MLDCPFTTPIFSVAAQPSRALREPNSGSRHIKSKRGSWASSPVLSPLRSDSDREPDRGKLQIGVLRRSMCFRASRAAGNAHVKPVSTIDRGTDMASSGVCAPHKGCEFSCLSASLEIL